MYRLKGHCSQTGVGLAVLQRLRQWNWRIGSAAYSVFTFALGRCLKIVSDVYNITLNTEKKIDFIVPAFYRIHTTDTSSRNE